MEDENQKVHGIVDKAQAESSVQLGSQIAERFKVIGLEQAIEELRDQPIEPTTFVD